MERGHITTDTTDIQRIIRGYYKQLYAYKLDNPEEIEKFLETWNLPRLNQKEIKILNRSISNKENWISDLKSCVGWGEKKKLMTRSFTGEFNQIFREDLTPTLIKLFQKKKKNWRRAFSNSFYHASIILIPKPEMNTTRRKSYRWYGRLNKHRKHFEEIQHPLKVKTFNKNGREEAYLNVIKAILTMPQLIQLISYSMIKG